MNEVQTIAVISAMREELAPLKQRLNIEEEGIKGGFLLSIAHFEGLRVILAVSGVGKANAAACMQQVITLYRPSEVINIGAAGSLNDRLQVGAMVLVSESLYHDVDCTGVGEAPNTLPRIPRVIPSDSGLIQQLSQVAANLDLSCHTGRIATGDTFVSDGERRKSIRKQTDAELVEMETAAFAQIAYLNGIPFVSVRSVSDNADSEAEISFETFLAETSERNARLLDTYLSVQAQQLQPVS